MNIAWAFTFAAILAPSPGVDPELQAILAAVEARMSASHSLSIRFEVDYSKTAVPSDPRMKLPTAPQRFEWGWSGDRWYYERIEAPATELYRRSFDGKKQYSLIASRDPREMPALQIGPGRPSSEVHSPEIATGHRLIMVDTPLLDALRDLPTRIVGRRAVGDRRVVELETHGLKVNSNAVVLTTLVDEARGAMQKMTLRSDLADPRIQRMGNDDHGKKWWTEVEVTGWKSYPADDGAALEFPSAWEFRQVTGVCYPMRVVELRFNHVLSPERFVIKPTENCTVVDSTGARLKTSRVGGRPDNAPDADEPPPPLPKIALPLFVRCPESLSIAVNDPKWTETFIVETSEKSDAEDWIDDIIVRPAIVRGAVARIEDEAPAPKKEAGAPTNRRYMVYLRGAGDVPEGRAAHAELSFVYKGAAPPNERRVRLQLTRTATMWCVPSLLFFDIANGETGVRSASVGILSLRAGDPGEISVVPHDTPWLRVRRIEPSGKPGAFAARMDVTVDGGLVALAPSDAGGLVRAALEFRSSDPLRGSVRLPIVVRVGDPAVAELP